MAQTQTVTVTERQCINLNLSSLKTVTWVESNPLVQYGSSVSKQPISKAREYKIIDLIVNLIQFQIGWIITLIHSVPWPEFIIKLIHRADEFVENVLETVFQKLEWWWDYISIRLMRLIETLAIYVDKLITFIDLTIEWLFNKFDWVANLAIKIFETAKGIFDWWVNIYRTVWNYIGSLLKSLQQIWKETQEELESQDRSLQSGLIQSQSSSCEDCSIKSESTTKRLSFSFDDDMNKAVRRKLSDSDMSDVAEIQETTKHLVGEKTGVRYNRIHAEAVVIGKKREEMFHRVNSKLQVMRKNSIRFSRGMDVRVSRFIGTMQKQFTPQSLGSWILSVIQYILLLPFKIIMWLVGGKSLTKRSRSVRSESSRRLEVAARINPPVLSPSEIKQSTEPASLSFVETPVMLTGQDFATDEEDIIKKIDKDEENDIKDSKIPVILRKKESGTESLDSFRRDSGMSEDNTLESSDEVNEKFQQTNSEVKEIELPVIGKPNLNRRVSFDDIQTPPSSPVHYDDKKLSASITDISQREGRDPRRVDSVSSFKSGESVESIPEEYMSVPKKRKTKKQVKIVH